MCHFHIVEKFRATALHCIALLVKRWHNLTPCLRCTEASVHSSYRVANLADFALRVDYNPV